MITIVVAIVILVLIMYFTANRRFSEYVTRVEMEQLDDLVVALGSQYEEKKSWNQFQDDPRFWLPFVWFYVPESPGQPPPPFMPGRAAGHWERSFSPGLPFVRPPERPDVSSHPVSGGTGQSMTGPPLPPPPPPRRESIGMRLALFDENKKVLAGPPILPSRGYLLRPINAGGLTVGWLGLMPLKHWSHPLESAFLKEQTRSLLVAGLCVLALAGAISFFLSKHFLSPIEKLTHATEQLASLNLGTRIEVKTNDELGRLAHAFNSMAQALEKNETLRKQWTSDVAHELRTPLAILRGEIEAMQDGVRDPSTERINSLHDETSRIGKLVDDLHLLFIADSKNLVREKSPVEVLKILRDVVGTFETRLAQADIRIEANVIEDQGAIIMGDEDRLRQLFANLIENTVRYTNPPGILRINHYCSFRNLTLVFEDSPPGVPTEALERVFDRLYRLDKSRSRALGGGGLGLSICEEIVNGHDGAIRAAHSSLGGLLISIEFPYVRTRVDSRG